VSTTLFCFNDFSKILLRVREAGETGARHSLAPTVTINYFLLYYKARRSKQSTKQFHWDATM